MDRTRIERTTPSTMYAREAAVVTSSWSSINHASEACVTWMSIARDGPPITCRYDPIRSPITCRYDPIRSVLMHWHKTFDLERTIMIRKVSASTVRFKNHISKCRVQTVIYLKFHLREVSPDLMWLSRLIHIYSRM